MVTGVQVAGDARVAPVGTDETAGSPTAAVVPVDSVRGISQDSSGVPPAVEAVDWDPTEPVAVAAAEVVAVTPAMTTRAPVAAVVALVLVVQQSRERVATVAVLASESSDTRVRLP